MADIQANIGINLETANAMARIKALQQEISNFHTAMSKGNATAQLKAAELSQSLARKINKTGQFSAQMTTIKTTTESFTNALEKNKLSMGEYFRYAGASTRTFGRLFKSEFETINKVARERVKTLQTQYIKMGRDASGAMKAMAVRPLALDMDNLATRTMLAAQKQQLFNQLLRQGSTNLLNFGKNTQWAGRQLMVGFTIPLTIFGATAAREFMKLEEQAIKFKRVYGDMFTTSGETEKALDNVRQLANEFTKYGIAVEETIGLAAKVAQMGNMGDALEAQVRQATRLSVLGGIEQQEALDTTISLTNAFGTEVEDLENKINFLNAAENQTILAIEDFNEAIPKAGSVVKTLGGDVEDLAFFLTAMREGGISASQAANALKSSLGRLINPTDAARKRLAEMGIDVVGIVEANAGNLRGTVMALGHALEALDPLTRARAIEQLFGKFQFARMSTMFANIVKDGSQANKVLQLTTSTTQELGILAERELGRVEDSVAYKFQKSLEQFQAALAPLGQAFLEAVTPLVEFGTKILNKFNELSDGTKQMVVVIGTILGAIGPVALMTFGLVANGVANLIKMFANLGLFYQRLTGQTQGLGISTQYMTQEQLEAAAVAASLNQSHATLIQTFTTEAGSLDRLTAAYNRAVAAQGRFRGVAAKGGGARPTEKLASGILSVPGPKGAGDIVPAMLSPGEAVIPAKQAQKYGAFIRNIIADNVPGFEEGVTLSPSQVQKKKKWHSAPESVRQATKELSWGTKDSELKALDRIAKKYNLPQQTVRNLSLGVASHIAPETKMVQLGDKMVPLKVWRAANLMPDLQANNQFTENLSSRSRTNILNDFKNQNNMDDLSKRLGIGKGQITQTLNKFSQGVAPSTRREAMIFKEIADQTFKNAEKAYKDATTKTERDKAFRRMYQSDAARAVMTERLKPQSGYYEKRPKYNNAINPVAAKQQQAKVAGANKLLLEQTKQEVKVKRQGNAVAKEVIKTEQNSQKQTQQKVAATEKSNKKAATREKAIDKADRQIVANSKKGAISATVDKNGKVMYFQNGKRISAQAAEQAIARSERGRQAAQTRTANRAASKEAAAGAGEAAAKSRMGIGLGGLSALAAVGAIGASFAPGKIGEVAQQLILPLMMLPAILPLLKNPIVLAVAAVAALGAGIYALHKQLKEASKSGRETAEAMSMNSEKLEGISEITGTVSASELRRRRQQEQLTAVGNEFSSFGIGFVQDSDQGKRMLEDIEKQLTSGRTLKEVGSNIGKQLSIAITQGVLTIDQARSIAGALGAEMGDYSFSTTISGKLTELLGVDGTDLLNNPLEVSIRIKEDSMREQVDIFERSMETLRRNQEPITGAAQIPFYSFFAMPAEFFKRHKENKEVSAALVQLGAEQLEQNQILVDSANARYDSLVAEAETQEQIFAIEQQRTAEISRLNELNAETTRQIIDQAELLKQERFMGLGASYYETSMDDALRATYSEGAEKIFADQLIRELDQFGPRSPMEQGMDWARTPLFGPSFLPWQRSEEEVAQDEVRDTESRSRLVTTLEFAVVNQLMSPRAALDLISLVQNNPTFEPKVTLALETKGPAEIAQLIQLMAQNDLDTESNAYSVIFDYIVNKDEPEFSDSLDALAAISSAESRYPVDIDLTVQGAEKIDAISEDLKEYNTLPETITKEAFVNIAAGDERLQAVLNNWEKLELTDNISREFVLDYIVNTYGDDSMVERYFSETGESASGSRTIQTRRGRGTAQVPVITDSDRYDAAAYFSAQGAAATTPYNEPDGTEDPPDSGGGGTPSSVLDNLLKKLRDVQDATIGVAKGWDAARQSLDRLFAGGDTIAKFSGLEQMMRRMNLGQNLIEMIVGMDPDEFEKRKGELFTFDGAGNITGITTALRNMQLAMNSIALGDFQNKQQETLTNYRNQIVAIDRLVRSGVSLSAAYAAVEDSAFAAAVAQEKSNRKIRDAAKDAEKAAKATRDFAAAQALVGAVEETANQREIADWLVKNRSRLTNAQVQAIIKDTNLQRLILNPKIDPRAVNQALADAANQADLDLKLNKLTIEGMTDIFNDGFSKAMEKFSAMEQQITLDFNLRTQDDEDIIKAAEREISTIRYQLDDLEADLTRIQKEEDQINKYYDDRIDALDEVSQINERLVKQQQAQMDIADALSQGDIAAAARARQEARQQQAQDAFDQRKQRLEDSREQALNSIRLDNGKSRLEIEQEIVDLQEQIFNIEEERLEPAQRRIELANQEKEDLIDSLEVLGRTREEWSRIQNNIDLARTSSDSYTKAIQNALDVVADILEYWNELDGKQVTTYHQIVETRNATPAPSGGGGGSSSSGPSTGDGNAARRDLLQRSIANYESKIAANLKKMKSIQSAVNAIEAAYRSRAVSKAVRDKTIEGYFAQTLALDSENASHRQKISQWQGELARLATGGIVKYNNLGGLMKMAMGGMFKSVNTDSIPAMLSAGEYVVKRSAVQNFGVENLEKINKGTYSDGSVYNYNLAVNVKSDADPNKIARTVISQIKQIDAQRIRGNRI